MRILNLWIAVLAAWSAGEALAQPAGGSHIAASLVAESSSPAPGTTVQLAIRMVPEPGWHGYWINPGDSGLAPTVRWTAPAGIRFGPLRHPAPTMIEAAGFASYVHAGPHALMATMSVPAGIARGTALPVKAEVNWLACTDSLCVPERATLNLNLVAGAGERDPTGRSIIASGLAALPKPLGRDGTATIANGELLVRIPVSGSTSGARVFPVQDGVFDAAAPQRVRRLGDTLEFAIPQSSGKLPAGFAGVVRIGSKGYAVRVLAGNPASGEQVSEAVVGGVPTAADAAAPESVTNAPGGSSPPQTMASLGRSPDPKPAAGVALPSGDATSFLAPFVFAVLGGLILNVMPCVFPILSLKAVSLARSGGSEAEARADALAFTAGTVLVCLALGSVLLLLRAGGTEVGWAFQLQNPYVVLGLLVVTTAIGLNLAGLFEMRGVAIDGALTSRPGATGSFWTGVLSAFVATPCSGPFMAGALGAAMILPAPAALAVFAGLGLGMALPFLAIGFVPALRRLLPKPGAWMTTFRRLLAIPMLLTALALSWLLGRQTGVDGMAIGLATVLIVAISLWWLGARQRRGRERNWAVLAPAAAIAALLIIRMPAEPTVAAAVVETATRQTFSEERLAELRARNVPVFVDFTADWCLSCKVNEKVAIETEEVQQAFAADGVVTLVGDWTRGDPAITRFLASHGRNSIPYYLFYGSGREPLVLPQVLSPSTLIALTSAAGAATQRNENTRQGS
jgi:thiol:disulfide interchange protein/DsbC/DsbD-like thiol-disulfide interchange protein